MNIRAVIFDVYGTLLELGPAPADAGDRWRRLFAELLQGEARLGQLEFSLATSRIIARHHDLARSRGIPWPEVFWPAVVREVLPELAQLAPHQQEEFLFRQMQTGHQVRLTEETAAVLRWLKDRNCRMGIASNAQAYTLREVELSLAEHGISCEIFERDLCFWSFEHGFSKPDPHVFQILTTRLAAQGIAASEILMVGDRSDNDIMPARAHGWRTWLLGAAGDGNWARLQNWLTDP